VHFVADLGVPDQLHFLITLARLGGSGKEQLSDKVAGALLSLDRRLEEEKGRRDNHWPLRLTELYAELSRLDPALNAALLKNPEFGRPDHALFARPPGFDRKQAAALFLKKATADPDYRWNADLVASIGELPDAEALPALRKLWGKVGVDTAILPVLARNPQAEDRPKFVTGLSSPQANTVRACLEALEKLPGKPSHTETLALIQALGRAPEGKAGEALRAALAARLTKTTGQKFGTDRQQWAAWFAKEQPLLAAKLTNPDGVDVAAWAKRLAQVDWAKGDAARGKLLFVKARCAACHSGGQALGPDLAGAAGRFSRADLFTAILQPSKDVSPRYQTTVLETAAGKIYQGLIVYEAVDSVILQTADETVRLAGDQVAARHVSPLSLMPAGLLDPFTAGELADLDAYLRSLGAPAKS
jgi:putative heme-binding domain-containing protein